jgi:hypothetical protein
MLGWLRKLINGEIAIGFALATLFWIGVLVWATSYAPTQPEKEACYQAAAKSGRSVDECKSFWEKTTSDPIAAFTCILAFSTIGLWISTIGLYFAGQKQFGLARDEFNATHRPRISVQRIGDWGIGDGEKPAFVNVPVVNSGETPTIITEFVAEIYIQGANSVFQPTLDPRFAVNPNERLAVGQ